MKDEKKVTESLLAKANLTPDEMKYARVYYRLATAGGEKSSTKKWFNALGQKKSSELLGSVQNKVHKVLSSLKGAGD